MDGANTPDVGLVLKAHVLTSIPEAHCYLKCGEQKIDATSIRPENRRQPIKRPLVELEITPEQTGSYKVQLHQEFMPRWMRNVSLPRAFTFEELWAVREACIHALETQT
jgi:hypothetical protein